MVRLRPSASLRGKLLLVVLACAVAPLGMLGFWLTRSAASSGEALLGAQLDSTLARVAAGIRSHWMYEQSDLLLLAENTEVSALARPPRTGEEPPAYISQVFGTVDPSIVRVIYYDRAGRPRWTLSSEPPAEQEPRGHGLLARRPLRRLEVPVRDPSGTVLGTLSGEFRASALIPGDTVIGGVAGAVLAVFDPRSGASLVDEPFARAQLLSRRFTNGGKEWLAARRSVAVPALELLLAAPLDPYVRPFRRTARAEVLALLAVLGGVLLITFYLVGRVTRKLGVLAAAADAVAAGDLSSQVAVSGRDEVSRVASAFNTMTASLRNTLRELSQRGALAAVGQFAATLSHEVRNSLTSLRVDLQRAEEKLGGDSAASGLVTRALGKVNRLDAAVTGALRVARSGDIRLRSTDLGAAVGAAVQVAEAEFSSRGVTLHWEPPQPPVWVEGDAGALEQLALNLLLNAAQATLAGGDVRVTIGRDGPQLLLSVRDTGTGIAADQLGRVVEPFQTTKERGTGLGLPIARQITAAHRGELVIETEEGRGTTVTVRLPALPEAKAVAESGAAGPSRPAPAA
jgi:signal transduction histidine kinase